MRFFKLHNDEVYAVVDASGNVKVTLVLARGGGAMGDPTHVELESYSWRYFRDNICKSCVKLPEVGLIDRCYLCNECPKEVHPR